MKKEELYQPTKHDVKNARIAAKLTQEEAAHVLGYSGYRTWQKWEYGERKMRKTDFKLFKELTAAEK